MLFYLQAFITSKVGFKTFRVNGSNLSCQVENILQLPIIYNENKKIFVDSLVKRISPFPDSIGILMRHPGTSKPIPFWQWTRIHILTI